MSAIAFPSIWIPRRKPLVIPCANCGRVKRRSRRKWWHRFVAPLAAQADGDVMLDDSGKVMLDSSGNVMLDDGSGCAECCESCPDSSECTSLASTYAITGWNNTFDCINSVTGNPIGVGDTLLPAFNGTLTQVSGACAYTTPPPGSTPATISLTTVSGNHPGLHAIELSCTGRGAIAGSSGIWVVNVQIIDLITASPFVTVYGSKTGASTTPVGTYTFIDISLLGDCKSTPPCTYPATLVVS